MCLPRTRKEDGKRTQHTAAAVGWVARKGGCTRARSSALHKRALIWDPTNINVQSTRHGHGFYFYGDLLVILLPRAFPINFFGQLIRPQPSSRKLSEPGARSARTRSKEIRNKHSTGIPPSHPSLPHYHLYERARSNL